MCVYSWQCYLWNDNLIFRPCTNQYDVEVKRYDGFIYKYSKQSIFSSRGYGYKGSGCQIDYVPYRQFRSKYFYMRFVDKYGQKGKWALCKNYTPIGIDLDKSGDVERINGSFEIDMVSFP